LARQAKVALPRSETAEEAKADDSDTLPEHDEDNRPEYDAIQVRRFIFL
jgi:hypothetical protein